MNINIARIKSGSMVDGPGGPRTVVWLQGCSLRCDGCQNWALWPAESSDMLSLSPEDAADLVLDVAGGRPITITGGEPFDQAEALGLFLAELRRERPALRPPHIILYTGYRYEDLVTAALGIGEAGKSTPRNAGAYLALDNADILVDGRYVKSLDNPYLQWRGSANQRPIDLQRTKYDIRHKEGKSAWLDPNRAPVTLDWSTPTVEIVGGTLTATGGLLRKLDFERFGLDVRDVSRCGEFDGLHQEEEGLSFTEKRRAWRMAYSGEEG